MPESRVGVSRPDVKKGNKVKPTTVAPPAASGGHGTPGDQTNKQKRDSRNRGKGRD